MKPIIVTLQPKKVPVEKQASAATFEEAFGHHSKVDGDDDDFYSADGDDDDFYNAKGKSKKSKDSKPTKKSTPSYKPKKAGFFSKEKRDARKEKRAVRRANRKAKYGARPLKAVVHQGVTKFKDKLPKLKKKKNAQGKDTFVKTLPDGTTKEVHVAQVKTIPNAKGGEDNHFDTADINTYKAVVQTVLENGEVELQKLYNQKETETVPNDQGVDTIYKKEDVVDSDTTDTSSDGKPAGMSKGLKIGLIVGGSVLALGIIGYVIYRSRKGASK